MIELPLHYLKELASQTIFISAFLGGFSAAILGTLIVSKRKEKVLRVLISAASFSAISFIVSVFAMTKLFLMATPGYPFEVTNSVLTTPRVIGSIAFFLGILALIVVIGASGWVQSRRLGISTTIMASIGFLLAILFLS